MPKAAAPGEAIARSAARRQTMLSTSIILPSIVPKVLTTSLSPTSIIGRGYTQTASGEWRANYALASDAPAAKQHPARIGCPASGLYYGISLAGILRCGQAESFCPSSAGGPWGLTRRLSDVHFASGDSWSGSFQDSFPVYMRLAARSNPHHALKTNGGWKSRDVDSWIGVSRVAFSV